MSDNTKSLLDSLAAFFASLAAQVHAALAVGIAQPPAERGEQQSVDPDFQDWLHNDPMITGNPASRYGDDSPGYLTRNGLGSLEIGAAED
jgi:hypothetical protein